MKINCVVFDLDGTLVRSHLTIYEALVSSLNKLDIKNDIPPEKFIETIGWHFNEIFERFGIDVPDFERFIEIYKSIYFDYIDQSELYPGAEEIINFLKENKIKIGLLTTKIQDQADRILEHFDLAERFDYVMGRRNGIAHKPSAEPLIIICNSLEVSPEETLMVGDSELDIRCGKNANTQTCGVTFGYRSKESLIKERPDFLIDNIADINYILNGIKK